MPRIVGDRFINPLNPAQVGRTIIETRIGPTAPSTDQRPVEPDSTLGGLDRTAKDLNHEKNAAQLGKSAAPGIAEVSGRVLMGKNPHP